MSDDPLVARLAEACTGEVVASADLAPYTTLKVGGPARVLVTAETEFDLLEVGAACVEYERRILIVGRGSNLLVSDAGWDGVAVRLGRGFRGVEIRADGRVRAGAAEPMPSLAAELGREGLTGFEFASAVPGTIGGGVRMNAGAHGREVRDVLTAVNVVRLDAGERQRWAAADLGFTYRHSALPADAIVVTVELQLERAEAERIRAEIEEIRTWRREHQPINEPNCGSVFTNPDGDSAGRLLEAAGLKGHEVGGARISDLHANFIVTRPGASADDVHALIEHARVTVADRFAVDLVPEVVRVGPFPATGA